MIEKEEDKHKMKEENKFCALRRLVSLYVLGDAERNKGKNERKNERERERERE